jgi:hypothetical protein
MVTSSIVNGACAALVALVATGAAHAAESRRVTVTGEVVDTWCTISQVMGYALGSAHFQCAVWCAVGGIPVSIRAEDETHYMVLRLGDDTSNVANPRIVDIQARQVTVDGDLLVRDGVNYLLVDTVKADGGVVNLSHEVHGILPFGE